MVYRLFISNRVVAIQKYIRVNNQIRAPIVRVISEKGEHLGDLPLTEALKRAYDLNLDLVEIAPNANPPIAKITDYGKFKYTQEKKEREQHKKQKEVDLKSIRISLGIGTHDKEIKAKAAKEFLEEGDKVSVEILLRGREKANREFARKKFLEFVALLGDELVVDQPVKPGPRGFSMIVSKKITKK